MASVYLGDAPAAAAEPRDLRKLRSFWHPVAAESDIGDEPYGVRLLGELVVVFRDEDGKISAFADLCPHRGAQLSKGHVVRGRLMCPYHGFQYDGEGKCRYIPSQPKDHQRIPARLKLAAYHTEVRYGLVWVAMEDPVSPIPDFPEYDDPDYHHFLGFDRTWNASAARFIENAMDISHFPWVHAGSLGDPDHPELPPFEVRDAPQGLWYEYDWELPASGGHLGAQVHYQYYIDVPFTIRLAHPGRRGRLGDLRADPADHRRQVQDVGAVRARPLVRPPRFGLGRLLGPRLGRGSGRRRDPAPRAAPRGPHEGGPPPRRGRAGNRLPRQAGRARPRVRLSEHRCTQIGTAPASPSLAAGPAGWSCAFALRERGYEGSITCVSAEPWHPYDRTMVSKDCLLRRPEDHELSLSPPGAYADAGVTLRLGVAAAALDPAAHRVRLSDGSELSYETLVIATGGRPLVPASLACPGVHVLRSLDDAARLDESLVDAERLVIVGGGFIAGEVATTAIARGLEVVMLEALDAPLARVVGPAVGERVAELHRRAGVDVRVRALARAITPLRDGFVVELLDGSAVSGDVVVVATGMVPAIDWLDGTPGISLDGGVVTDERCATGAPDVYAAGDCARWLNRRTGR